MNEFDPEEIEQRAQRVARKIKLTNNLTDIIIDYLIENNLGLSTVTSAVEDMGDRIFERFKAKSAQ